MAMLWRFIEPIADCGFYEDEIVEHMGTLGRARRRSFVEKFTRDEVAVEQVALQARAAAAVLRPSLPRFYGAELVDSRYRVMHEQVQGASVLDLARRGAYQAPIEWADLAARLCQELEIIEMAGMDFSRLRIAHIVLGPRGAPRFTTYWPVDYVRRDILEQSPYLQRLVQSAYGGLFVAEGGGNRMGGLAALRLVLFHLASGKDSKSIEQAQEEERREQENAGGRGLGSILGVDRAIGEFILSIDTGQGRGTLSTLGEINRELRKLRARAVQARIDATLAAQAQLRANTGDPSAAPDRKDAPKSVAAMAAAVISNEARIQSAQAPQPVAPSAQDVPAAPGSAPAFKPKVPPAPPSEPGKLEYDVRKNRYEGDDPGEYLYPDRPASSAAAAAAPVAPDRDTKPGAAAAASPLASVTARPSSNIPWGKVLLGIGAVAGIAAIGFAAMNFLPKKENKPPVAAISSFPAEFEQLATVEFSADGSSDPEGATLSYTWGVEGRTASDHYRFLTSNGPDAKVMKIQFFEAGPADVTLRVFDGAAYSETARVSINVTPQQRR